MTTAIAAYRKPMPNRTHMLDVIRAEFTEMPDMHLTRAQVRRLWTLTNEECDDLLDSLLRCGFLVCGQRDFYRRRSSNAA
jgi:hypothetical protein